MYWFWNYTAAVEKEINLNTAFAIARGDLTWYSDSRLAAQVWPVFFRRNFVSVFVFRGVWPVWHEHAPVGRNGSPKAAPIDYAGGTNRQRRAGRRRVALLSAATRLSLQSE